jgi:hypothetical protein
VLGNKLTYHLKMAELLHRDVLEHIADAGILDVEGLHPILERRGQFASCTPELLKQKGSETSIGLSDLDWLYQFLEM